MAKARTIGFIGAGNMAEALCRGILTAELVAPAQVIAADVSEARRRLFAGELGARTTADNAAAAAADVVVLAIKPQMLDAALTPVGAAIGADKLLISILAGVRTARIEALCAAGARVVRAMPNTPMLVGAGIAALCKGAHATDADLAAASEIFRCAAEVVVVDEAQMDAVTAVSGSGPAYFFYLVEAMTAAGVAEGLSAETAARLAGRTLLGAGRLLEESGESAATLRARVTSPGGTTQAALERMQQDGVKEALTAAVRRAAARSRELAG